MAINNNLSDFLTAIADAIRTKKGTTAKINPQNFGSEIAGIGDVSVSYITEANSDSKLSALCTTIANALRAKKSYDSSKTINAQNFPTEISEICVVTITSNVSSTIVVNNTSYSNVKSKTIIMNSGDTLNWSISASGYTTQSGSQTITEDTTINKTLVVSTVTVTITSNVSSTITIAGSSSSNVTTKTVSVNTGSSVSWSVSANGYYSQSGTLNNVTSNQSKSVTLTAIPVYIYKVYSNIIGASVYFDGTYKGTINSGGYFSTSIQEGNSQYNVTLSGGTIPVNSKVSNTTTISGEDTSSTVSTYTKHNVSINPTALTFGWDGGSQDVTFTASYTKMTVTTKTPWTRTRTTINYYDGSYPSGITVSRNSSVTANAVYSTTVSRSEDVDGDKSYGTSYQIETPGTYYRHNYETPSISGSGISCALKSNTGSNENMGYIVTVSAGSYDSTTSDRSGTITFTTGTGGNKTLTVTQTKRPVYNVTITSNVSSTITINGTSYSNVKSKTVSIASGSSVQWKVSADGYVEQSGEIQTITGAKTVNVTLVKNTTYSFSVSPTTSSFNNLGGTAAITISSSGSDGSTPDYSYSSDASWLTFNKSTSKATIAASTTSSRTGTITFTQNTSGNTATYKATQTRGVNNITIQYSSGTITVKTSYTATSQLTISIAYTTTTTTTTTTVSVAKGSSSGSTSISDLNTIASVTISPTSDNTWKYVYKD